MDEAARACAIVVGDRDKRVVVSDGGAAAGVPAQRDVGGDADRDVGGGGRGEAGAVGAVDRAHHDVALGFGGVRGVDRAGGGVDVATAVRTRTYQERRGKQDKRTELLHLTSSSAATREQAVGRRSRAIAGGGWYLAVRFARLARAARGSGGTGGAVRR